MNFSTLHKVWLILQYYYRRQTFLPWLALLGLLLELLNFIAINYSPNLSFACFIFSLTFMFLIPFMASCTTLRELISNKRLALIPGFKMEAGMALLAIIIIPSFWWSLHAWYFGEEIFSMMAVLRSFIFFSFVAGLMQLILPLKYFVQIISILPIALVLIVMQFRVQFTAFFYNDLVILSLFILSVLGWIGGLYILRTRQQFSPPLQQIGNIDYWSYDGGIFQKKAIGESSSASGTLLLGYPDGWKGIISKIVNYMVITPLITVLFFYLIGFGQEFEFSQSQALFSFFLLMSLSSACACISIFGEMAPRCRLIWLRQGGNRESQWQTLEQLTLKIISSYLLIAGIIAVLTFVYSMLPALMTLHYFMIIFSFCTFTIYLSLWIKVYNWSVLLQSIIVVLIVSIMVAGMIISIDQDNYFLISLIEASYILLAILLRFFTRKEFLGIDWFQIKYKRPGKLATS